MVGSWWSGVRLVAGRSLSEGLHSKALRITTLILLVIGLAVVFVPRLLSGGESTYTLATVGEVSAPLRAQMDAAGEAAEFGVEYSTVDDGAAAEAAVRAGDATVALAGDTLYVRSDAPATFAAIVTQSVLAQESAAKLAEAGLSADQIAALAAIEPPGQVEVGPARDEGRAGVGFVVGIVLYVALIAAGQSLAVNVGMEKSTRIAEVLLAVLRPSQILVGNVIGMGLRTLIQLLALAVPILTAIALTDGLDLPSVAAADIALAVLWFLVGYLVYAFLFAATAVLVDKVTDVGAAVMPVMVLLVMAYIGAVSVVPLDPGSSLSVFLSMFPLTSPMAMPIRWASGTVPVWELVTSLLLALGTALLFAWFGARIYQRALVVTGRKVKLREVLVPRG